MGIRLTKTATELTDAARAEISRRNFALTSQQSSTGKPAYPIHDREHARSALGMVGMHGTPAQKEEVRSDVAKKFPDLVKKAGPMPGLLGRMKNVVTGATPMGAHANELAGLGVLAVPGIDHLQAHGRAMLAGEDTPEGIENRRLFGEGAHAAMDVGGLGLLAAPAAHHLLSAKHAMVDELLKIGAVSDEQAARAADRIDTLERTKPTLGQAARYGAFGAIAAPAVGAVANAIKGKGFRGGLTGMNHLRDVAGDAVKGGISGGLLPLAQRAMDRRAEESTLKEYLNSNNESREFSNSADKMAAWRAPTHA